MSSLRNKESEGLNLSLIKPIPNRQSLIVKLFLNLEEDLVL